MAHHAGHEKEPPAKHDKVHPPFHSHSAISKKHHGGKKGHKRGRK